MYGKNKSIFSWWTLLPEPFLRLTEYDGQIPEEKQSEGGLKTKWPNFTTMSPKTMIDGI